MLRQDEGQRGLEGPLIAASPFPVGRAGEVLTAEALAFVAELHRRFNGESSPSWSPRTSWSRS